MNILGIFKKTFEEIIEYYNNECLQERKIFDQQIKINIDVKEIKEIESTEQFSLLIEKAETIINNLRQENQAQLENESFDVKIFAKNEVILSSANTAIESLAEAFKNVNFLLAEGQINEKFALRKVLSIALNLISKYEQLPNRLKKSQELSNIMDKVKFITNLESIDEILIKSREILVEHNKILSLDHFVNYDALVEEYGWVHDVVKLSKVNAGVIGLLVNVEVFNDILSLNVYTNKQRMV
ncbi:hypothetical protein [Spiroplasma culicicola]|uniref:Uncharacterized protein n=1 Tax=Spiroplasma culicicola AES-1 TaxID=1276246 RepID=W6A7Y4_9MOLU|nr:hypothetical protein [Spiroplasma culicicola]AHI53228.1 hypothetical protein SCULI_v1c08880 [Spiroplasma culicicola AES-1]